MKAAELREFMAPIDREKLPSIEEAKELAEERERRRQDAKLEASYSRSEDYVTQTQAALKDHARRQKELDETANRDSLWDRIESGEKSRETPPQQANEKPSERSEDEERIARLLDEDHRDRRKDDDAAHEVSRERRDTDHIAAKFDNVEMTEAQQQKMQRLLDSGVSERDDDLEPDKQREVPGGGRTRSR